MCGSALFCDGRHNFNNIYYFLKTRCRSRTVGNLRAQPLTASLLKPRSAHLNVGPALYAGPGSEHIHGEVPARRGVH